jgi:hypothetical protein
VSTVSSSPFSGSRRSTAINWKRRLEEKTNFMRTYAVDAEEHILRSDTGVFSNSLYGQRLSGPLLWFSCVQISAAIFELIDCTLRDSRRREIPPELSDIR